MCPHRVTIMSTFCSVSIQIGHSVVRQGSLTHSTRGLGVAGFRSISNPTMGVVVLVSLSLSYHKLSVMFSRAGRSGKSILESVESLSFSII